MDIAIVGCGYVADMYMQTLPAHPGLNLVGVWDRDPARLAAFTAHHKIPAFAGMDALLADPRVQMVVNLTNPRSHHAVSRAALQAGRHVYSEKPLAMTMAEASELVSLAAGRGLGLAAAPCNHLGNAVATLRDAVRSGLLGRPLLAYAEMDDGMVAGLAYKDWRSLSGAPWPAKDEFEVGCTMEHAGYQVTPLVELFGPVRRVTSFNHCFMPEKGADLGVEVISPDFSTGILEFDGGMRARLTNSILASADRSLRVVGTEGVATLSDVWEYDSPVRHSRTGMGARSRVMRKLEKRLSAVTPGLLFGRRLPGAAGQRATRTQGGHHMDFARGIAQLAAQVADGAETRVGPALALHVTEVTLALQDPDGSAIRTMTTGV